MISPDLLNAQPKKKKLLHVALYVRPIVHRSPNTGLVILGSKDTLGTVVFCKLVMWKSKLNVPETGAGDEKTGKARASVAMIAGSMCEEERALF